MVPENHGYQSMQKCIKTRGDLYEITLIQGGSRSDDHVEVDAFNFGEREVGDGLLAIFRRIFLFLYQRKSKVRGV